MRMRTLLGALVALMIGVTASFAVSSPAQAATKYTMHTDDTDPGGRVEFWPNGDVVKLCDIEADGWGVGLTVLVLDGWENYDLEVGGNGNCKERRASMGAAYDMVEGGTVEFYIYLYKTGECSVCYDDLSSWKNIN
ncbi:hypothetical protein WEI85_25965 [Actinomycetes bacterium KLBMP 9797]